MYCHDVLSSHLLFFPQRGWSRISLPWATKLQREGTERRSSTVLQLPSHNKRKPLPSQVGNSSKNPTQFIGNTESSSRNKAKLEKQDLREAWQKTIQSTNQIAEPAAPSNSSTLTDSAGKHHTVAVLALLMKVQGRLLEGLCANLQSFLVVSLLKTCAIWDKRAC